MTRLTNEKRPVTDATLTLRLTQNDRELLQALVERQAIEMADTGVEVTAASLVRGLIRHAAREKGILDTPATSPAGGAPREERQPR